MFRVEPLVTQAATGSPAAVADRRLPQSMAPGSPFQQTPDQSRPGFSVFSHRLWDSARLVMNMIRKGQLQQAAKGDVLAQNHFIAELFGSVA